jgi:hypothetical protein
VFVLWVFEVWMMPVRSLVLRQPAAQGQADRLSELSRGIEELCSERDASSATVRVTTTQGGARVVKSHECTVITRAEAAL